MPIKDVCKMIMRELEQIHVAGRDCRRMIAALDSLQAIIDALDANTAQKKDEKQCS